MIDMVISLVAPIGLQALALCLTFVAGAASDAPELSMINRITFVALVTIFMALQAALWMLLGVQLGGAN